MVSQDDGSQQSSQRQVLEDSISDWLGGIPIGGAEYRFTSCSPPTALLLQPACLSLTHTVPSLMTLALIYRAEMRGAAAVQLS